MAIDSHMSRGELILDAIEDEVMMRLNPGGDECPHCGGEGFIDGECTCGDDTCCCAWPTPPECTECQRFKARFRREVRIEVLRTLDVDIGIAFMKQKGQWRDGMAPHVLLGLHTGRVGSSAFTSDERADSACWVEGLL